MDDYSIRPFQDDDLSDLLDIEFFKKGVVSKLLNSFELQQLCFVAVNNCDGEVVGFICGEKTLFNGYILYAGEVKQKHKRKGVFTKLLVEFEKQCVDDVITVCHSQQLDDFYEKRGYYVGKNLNVSIKVVVKD